MNGHAVSAVPALTGLQKPKSFGINGTSGATSSATASMGSEAASPSPSNASAAQYVPASNGSGPNGTLSGASPYFQPAAVNMNYASQSGQMMGGYAYYHPQHQQQQQQQQQQHQGYAAYALPGSVYPMRTPNGASSNGTAGSPGYNRQHSYNQQQQAMYQQQQHQHVPAYDYNSQMHHSAGNGAGPSRYQNYSPYNPYYPQPVYAQHQPNMQASPYPVYQPSGAAYAGPQPMYYDPNMFYPSPGGSNRPPYNYAPQGASGPYPYAMHQSADASHPMSAPLPPQTPSSASASPYPASQIPPATIATSPLPPPRESDQPPQPPPPKPSSQVADSTGARSGSDEAMPVFASVMRSTVTIKKDDAVPSVTNVSEVRERAETPKAESHDEPSRGSIEKDSAVFDSSVATSDGPKETESQVAEEAADPRDIGMADNEAEQSATAEPAPAKQEVPEGFQSDSSQTYLYARGVPAKESKAPAVLFSSRMTGRLVDRGSVKQWKGEISHERGIDSNRSAETNRKQDEGLSFARQKDRLRAGSTAFWKFGEIDISEVAKISDSKLREADRIPNVPTIKSTAESVAEGSGEKENVAEGAVQADKQVPATETAPAPSTESASTPSTESAPVSTPAPVKVAPKSWAALLRPSQTAASKSAIGVAASSSTTSVSGSGTDSAPNGPGAASSVPGRAPGYASAAASSHRNAELDLGKLLSEGVGGLPLSAGASGLASVPRGLINTGNMCFANSIMQVLAYCNPFNILLQELSKRVKADLGGRTRLLEAMMLFLREFAAAEMGAHDTNGTELSAEAVPANSRPQTITSSGIANSGEAFVPTYVYEAMKENKRFDSMRRGHQEDAEEFMGFFLETLHEELLYLVSRHEARTVKGPRKDTAKVPNKSTDEGEDEREVSRPVSPSAGRDDGWLEVGKNQKLNVVRTTTSRESAISRIFGGKLRSVLRTPGQKDSVTLEPYQPLQLDISSPNVHTITEALLHLNEPETISGVYSASRGMNVDATKTVYLETVPPILTLHLKRFLYDPVEMRVVKKGKAVAYGPELLIPSSIISPARRPSGGDLRYKLFGVVYHHGNSATGGHYTACVLKQDGKGWLHLDDELVENVEGEAGVYVTRDAALHGDAGTVGRSMRSKCAYLLFYARV